MTNDDCRMANEGNRSAQPILTSKIPTIQLSASYISKLVVRVIASLSEIRNQNPKSKNPASGIPFFLLPLTQSPFLPLHPHGIRYPVSSIQLPASNISKLAVRVITSQSEIERSSTELIQLLLEHFRQRRYNFKQVPDDSIVAFAENGRIFVRIDSNDNFGCLHAGKMLNGTG